MDEERQEDFRSRVSFSRAELIIKILLPTKLSYSNSIERLNSLLGDCFPFRFHLRGGFFNFDKTLWGIKGEYI